MFVWDEKKRLSNLEKHGLDLVDASLVYDSPVKITVESRQRDEDRMMDMAMVKLAETVLVLVYTIRGDDIRVISFCRASRAERRFYEQAAS
jgi:uncharacterized DUF497 family protein